jgi:hypothetical protein
MNKYYLRHRVKSPFSHLKPGFSGHLKAVGSYGQIIQSITDWHLLLHILLLTKPQPILRPVYTLCFCAFFCHKSTNDLLNTKFILCTFLRCFRHRLPMGHWKLNKTCQLFYSCPFVFGLPWFAVHEQLFFSPSLHNDFTAIIMWSSGKVLLPTALLHYINHTCRTWHQF